ncbi:hypothetical protein [Noviherbaspirillum sp.]|uniref:hypothetical protein n=1 Tax=Noviherbaspirillum sp. TaxID=1926288 RepID=UPI002D4089E3|nr:hypothetical protein [Noviherbaspirillum sp.]HZW21562.1 hypothetical protein [Noviherbaspirillum sp.]
MALTEMQGVVWKQIAHAYDQWDPEWNRLMPVSELAELLPAVAPEMIGDTLGQAAADHIAEVGQVGEDPVFRPLQRDQPV